MTTSPAWQKPLCGWLDHTLVKGKALGLGSCVLRSPPPPSPSPLSPCSRVRNACSWAGSFGGMVAAASVENSGWKFSFYLVEFSTHHHKSPQRSLHRRCFWSVLTVLNFLGKAVSYSFHLPFTYQIRYFLHHLLPNCDYKHRLFFPIPLCDSSWMKASLRRCYKASPVHCPSGPPLSGSNCI